MINYELLLKIIEIKNIAQKEGSLPQSIPNIEKSICREIKWLYRRESNNGFSIQIKQKPSWWQEGNLDLPLNYNELRPSILDSGLRGIDGIHRLGVVWAWDNLRCTMCL